MKRSLEGDWTFREVQKRAGSDSKIAMVMEELYDIVDSIADLTVEDVKRHLSNRC